MSRDSRGRFTSSGAADYGRRGGHATVRRHGSEYMRRIGRRGFLATLQRHWKGDRESFLDFLTREGRAATDAAPWNGAFQKRRPWGHIGWPL